MLRALSRVTAVGAVGCAGGAAWYYFEKNRPPPTHSALQPGKSLSCKLQHVEQLTTDTARFRFELPSSEHVLGLPTASHIVAVDNAMVYREYTPTTLDQFDKGYFDLIVKHYQGGTISGAIHRLVPGDTMDFRGPITTLNYTPNEATCLGMIAGGTGITPMYQIIRTVLHNPADKTQLRLLYASRSAADILLKVELDSLAEAYPEQLQVQYIVGSPTAGLDEPSVGANNSNRVSTGRVDAQTIKEFMLPPDSRRSAMLVCGPPGMMHSLCGPAKRQGRPAALGGALRRLGYGAQVVRFD